MAAADPKGLDRPDYLGDLSPPPRAVERRAPDVERVWSLNNSDPAMAVALHAGKMTIWEGTTRRG